MTLVLHLTDDTENKIIYNSPFAPCNKLQGFHWYSQKQQLVEDGQLLSTEENEILLEAEVLSPRPSFHLRAIGPALGNTEGHAWLPY